jgi:CelD/BcsL family acetyltransferase involved in cellulose biosynthesis
MCSLLQKRRKLEREQGDIEFTFASTDMAALATLIDWKSAQYARTGHFDRFSRPWIRDLVRLLAACDEPACRGTLSTLSVGGRLIAAHFGIRTTTRLSLWFPSYDLEFARYSPGLQLFLALAEAAPDHGVRILDLGKGTETYKLSLASWSYPMASGRVEAKPFCLLGSPRSAVSAKEGGAPAAARPEHEPERPGHPQQPLCRKRAFRRAPHSYRT